MESYHSQITKNRKLGLLGILKESSKIPFRNPKFIVLTGLASLPLFFAMFLPELILQKSLISLAKTLSKHSHTFSCHSFSGCYYYFIELRLLDFADTAFQQVSLKYLLPGLLYLGLVLFLDLVNTIVVVYLASQIYTSSSDEDDGLAKELKKVELRGPLVTSSHVLLLDLLALVGFLSLAGQCIFFELGVEFTFVVLYGSIFVVLMGKYVEWSGVCKMGIVISVLEKEKQGIVAVGVQASRARAGACVYGLEAVFKALGSVYGVELGVADRARTRGGGGSWWSWICACGQWCADWFGLSGECDEMGGLCCLLL